MNSTKKQRGKVRPKNQKTSTNRRQNPYQQIDHLNSAVGVPRYMRGPFPYSEMVRIRTYLKQVVQGASPFIVVDIKLNDVFNPVPAYLATGLAAGYAGSAARYTQYHVQGTEIRVSFSNNENFSLSAALVYSDTQISTTVSSYPLAERAMVSTGTAYRTQLATQTGQGRSISPVFKIRPGSILGNSLIYNSDTNFVSSYGASPAQVVWAAVIIISDNLVTNLTNGLFLDLDLAQVTRNYSPVPTA